MKTKTILSLALILIAAGLFGMGSQAGLYTAAEDLVDKMIAWSKECAGKTDADCSRNLDALRKTAFEAAEFANELGQVTTDDKNPDGDAIGNGKAGWKAPWRMYGQLFIYHGKCFNRYDAKECREMWVAQDKERTRLWHLYGPEPRWRDFPDALRHRTFKPIPTKHIGDEMARHWFKVPGTEMELYSDQPAAEKSGHNYVYNSKLPPDCVETAPDAKLKAGTDFWTQPPASKPLNVPDTCVLTKLYQKGQFLGWIYMEKSSVERLHMAAQTASPPSDGSDSSINKHGHVANTQSNQLLVIGVDKQQQVENAFLDNGTPVYVLTKSPGPADLDWYIIAVLSGLYKGHVYIASPGAIRLDD